MGSGAVHEFEAVLLLLLALVVIFAALAHKLQTPYPIVLVIAGLCISFLPGIPAVKLNPEIIFLAVLPPLLYHASWMTSWREFRFNLVSIAMLAFGLVGFTVAGIAVLAPHVLHGFDWRLGFVLGAVVAPTDAIAATSIANRVGLPKRIVDLLEGESLLNDATGLLALEFGIAMVVAGNPPTIASGLGRLLWLTGAGVAIGLIIGFLVDFFERRLEDGPIEITLNILVPYAAYLLAESAHASGVLAVVACGLWVSWRSAEFFSPAVRLQSHAVWDAFSFVLNGVTFVLIGLQLPAIWAGIAAFNRRLLLVDGAVFSVLLILLRLIWVFPGSRLAHAIRRRVLKQQVELPSRRESFVLGWTGMRGVISLAAAISLPVELANGQAFPERNLIIFLTFNVILVTLVVQGLSLPAVIRMLGFAAAGGPDCEELEARTILTEEALKYLAENRRTDSGESAVVYQYLSDYYQARLHELKTESSDTAAQSPAYLARYRELQRRILQLERNKAVQLRNQGRINDEILSRLQRELDLNEMRLSVSES